MPPVERFCYLLQESAIVECDNATFLRLDLCVPSSDSDVYYFCIFAYGLCWVLLIIFTMARKHAKASRNPKHPKIRKLFTLLAVPTSTIVATAIFQILTLLSAPLFLSQILSPLQTVMISFPLFLASVEVVPRLCGCCSWISKITGAICTFALLPLALPTGKIIDWWRNSCQYFLISPSSEPLTEETEVKQLSSIISQHSMSSAKTTTALGKPLTTLTALDIMKAIGEGDIIDAKTANDTPVADLFRNRGKYLILEREDGKHETLDIPGLFLLKNFSPDLTLPTLLKSPNYTTLHIPHVPPDSSGITVARLLYSSPSKFVLVTSLPPNKTTSSKASTLGEIVASLTVFYPNDIPRAYPIKSGRNLIGRALNGPGIQINASTVSKVHATIEVTDDNHVISDNQSCNGTTVGERRLTGEEQVTLSHGCVLYVGSVKCLYEKIQPVESSSLEPRAIGVIGMREMIQSIIFTQDQQL